jgi:prolyl 4-hydroxylase
MKQSYPIQKICKSPEIFVVEDFLNSQECEYIICTYQKYLSNSMTTGGKKFINTNARTSLSCFIDNNDFLSTIREKICQIHNWETDKTEKFQFALYNKGDFYGAHYDAFDIKNLSSLSPAIRDSGQRIITNIIYLNSTLDGGDTCFPRLNLSIKPKAGNLLAFQNCIEGTNFLNPHSIHESRKVLEGKKWILSLWLREY